MSCAEPLPLPLSLSRSWQAPAAQVALPANALGVSSARWELPVDSLLRVPAMPQHRLIVNLAPLGSHRIWVDGRLVRSAPSATGAIRIAPPGETARAQVRGARFHFAQVYLPGSALAAAQHGRSSSPLQGLCDPRFDAGDAPLVALVARFLAAQAAEPLLGEHLAMSIARHLVQRYGISSNRRTAACERLHPRVARQLEDFIEAHLGEPLSVRQLAAQAGLSEHHFARAFAGTFGAAPYAYVSERRICRAQALLAQAQASIVETALACGFSSQAAFTTAFRRRMGRAPGAWRAGLG